MQQQSEHYDFLNMFSKHSNGDLWRIFHDLVASRGPLSVCVSKTKGHALEDREYLEAHPHLRQQAIYNDRSDTAARAALH
eukprot:3760237-Karenia_brevis.AAC.1